ncbi:hypothetical protein ScPMuIL_001740 [Solemya velum]
MWLPGTMLFLVGIVAKTDAVNTVRLHGAGASFPNAVYQAWIQGYRTHRSKHVNLDMTYESVGSGNGEARISGEKGPPIDYAGSDSISMVSDYENQQDLHMLPTMAGAVVLAYNLPEIGNLSLTKHQIVSIYSGGIRWWDDPSIANSNPLLTLPHERIIVIARSDKSGSTEIFTRFLSEVSEEWSKYPGIFSAGLNSDRISSLWNSSAVKFYGHMNVGIIGLIHSLRYSIGYTVLADAKRAELQVASILNRASIRLVANTVTIQYAMDDFYHNLISNNKTYSIVNPDGDYSYPISAFTFFIVRMSTMKNCDTAIELLRFIRWFLTTDSAREMCINHFMVPLTQAVANEVIDAIQKKMTCKGENVYTLMVAKIENEQSTGYTWQVSVYVTIPLIFVLLIALFGYITQDQIKQHRALLKNEWRIPADTLHYVGRMEKKPTVYVKPMTSSCTNAWENSVMSIAIRGDETVLLAPEKNLSTTVGIALKKKVLLMRNSLRHSNIVRFYGLSEHDGLFYSVCEFNFRFTLETFLSIHKNNLRISTQFAVAHDIALGMNYLHDKCIVHGSLNSANCFVGNKWNIMVGDWMQHSLVNCQKSNAVEKLIPPKILQTDNDIRGKFWVSPEILKYDRSPNYSSDVYSYAIVLQEIFTYESPYAEYSGTMTPFEIINGIMSYYLRPTIRNDTPDAVKTLMEQGWATDTATRPTFSSIIATLKTAAPEMRSVIDFMVESMEMYISQLEKAARKYDIELQKEREKLAEYTNNQVPTSLAIQLASGNRPESRVYENLPVMALALDNIDKVIQNTTPEKVTRMLDSVLTALAKLFSDAELSWVDQSPNYFTVTSVNDSSSDTTNRIATVALDCLDFVSNSQLDTESNVPLHFKIGIHSGRVVGGLVGRGCNKYFLVGAGTHKARSLSNSACENTIRISNQTSLHLTTFPVFIVHGMSNDKGIFVSIKKHYLPLYPTITPTEGCFQHYYIQNHFSIDTMIQCM